MVMKGMGDDQEEASSSSIACSSTSGCGACDHCGRQISLANLELHAMHCKRYLESCKLCGDMIPRRRAQEHYQSEHAPLKCSLCAEAFEPPLLAKHEKEQCPRRMVACSFCSFPVHAVDLAGHAEPCGNRTELCIACNKYVRLRDKIAHDLQHHTRINHGQLDHSTVDDVEPFLKKLKVGC
ncbi:hypothetical protein GOP47_0005460 [Adiantum capillus-veneris]|uniref:TRAF-type domain-containing protein n=1 Tax=Adiantum capillus-veneris TaxID=13818 RepID=A0A9D4V545_ADICA|nr:hypothetical protein GOP47_0005460 [Adiantum capillus-veneris]